MRRNVVLSKCRNSIRQRLQLKYNYCYKKECLFFSDQTEDYPIYAAETFILQVRAEKGAQSYSFHSLSEFTDDGTSN